MRKNGMICLLVVLMLPFGATVTSSFTSTSYEDFDPLVDVSVTVEVQVIRFLEVAVPDLFSRSIHHGLFRGIVTDLIKPCGDTEFPDFYVKVFINEVEFTSDVWRNMDYIYDPQWSITLDVPDTEEFVDVRIQLWDALDGDNTEGILCDISGDSGGADDGYDVELVYSIKTGHWDGDDALTDDPSGYGRLCGCDDGTIYEEDRDCELWFTIMQNDYDGDGIPYWTEVHVYGTDPAVPDTGDPDNDEIPVAWEYTWGYNPFSTENHETIDPEGDSLNNVEEYLTSAWYSDPFRKDVFVELDIMDEGPNGETTEFPITAGEYITTAFDRQNIVFHLDRGSMGGHDVIPFRSEIDRRALEDIYREYFLHGDSHNWRRGVFHYGLVNYNADPHGYMFRSNAYQIASLGLEGKLTTFPYLDKNVVYGSAYMHELGHTFDFRPIPGHNPWSRHPLQLGWWLNRPYKSCMNYAWMYQIVDYSDGSHRAPDLDDWNRIDYDAFEREWD
jgi:hypothetical protein